LSPAGVAGRIIDVHMYVLADTSIWIEHLRGGSAELAELLPTLRVLTHSVILGELACGHLPRRQQLLDDLDLMPRIREASIADVRVCIETRKLFGRGIGWSDAQLVTSAMQAGARLLTRDKRLAAVWDSLC
jgi:predicted nucleic acid-binding protein